MDKVTTDKIILVIEDEVSLLHALVDKFSREGFFVLQAKNGEEGLDLVPSII